MSTERQWSAPEQNAPRRRAVQNACSRLILDGARSGTVDIGRCAIIS
jgi:hypothetical protein